MSFSFGTPSSAPATTGLTSGFSFGANKPATPGFGLTTTQPSTGLFGTTTAPAFGTTATPAFGASTSSFGTTSTPTFGTTGLNFGTATTQSTQPTSLSFGTPAATGGTGLGGLGGFGFGTTQTSTTQTTGLGLFGATSTATTSTSLFGAKLNTTTVTGTQPSTTAPSSFGLGGVLNSTGIGVASSTTDGKEQQPKQTKLPNELVTTIDSFKEFVKKQKSLSSDIMRVSIKPFHKITREAEETLRAVVSISGEVRKARAQSRRLRTSAADALAAAEQAARDTTGSELESTAPPLYVKELISDLEQQLITFRRQMDVADKQMQATPRLLSEQELTLGIRRMHESLVALAGRLQAVHAQVEAQKEQYLNLRKYILKDHTDVFASQTQDSNLDQILRDSDGNKKMKTTRFTDLSQNSAVLSDPRAALGNIQQLAGPSPFTYVGTTLSSFPSADNTGSSWQQTQSSFVPSFNTSGLNALSTAGGEASTTSFQLQKPPKRGKQ